MALGNVWEFRARGTYLGQQTLNVFHYEQTTTGNPTDSLADLAQALYNDVLGVVGGVLTDEVYLNDITVEELFGSHSTHVEVIEAGNGALTGTPMPPFVAWSWLLRRTNNTTFNGHKRFAGVREEDIAAGVYSGGLGVALTSANDALSAKLHPSSFDYSPVIYSKILNGVPRTPPVANLIAVAVFQGVSSQNTRKIGRGA